MDTNALQKFITRESMKAEFEQKLDERVQRYLDVKPHGIIPNHQFASASTECAKLYANGYNFACVALVQAVAEAILRMLSDVHLSKHPNSYEKGVKDLCGKGFIDKQLESALLTIWRRRNDFHHLNPNVPVDYQVLDKLAKEKLSLLNYVESVLFAFTVDSGRINPKNPRYWKIRSGRADVYLRLA
ncbi:MAG: hypothetical protein AB1597_05505 [Chloroflexota bacterium]